MRIGIFGGTFNPPHRGHVTMARAAVEQLSLDKLLVIPAGIPPHKQLPEGSASNEQRYEMAVLLAGAVGKCAVADDRELRREGKSYTADTLLQLREEYPEDELWLLMGSDMFLSLHTWCRPEVVCRAANIAAFSRCEADERAAFEAQKANLEQLYSARVAILDNPNVIEVSSTDVRAALSADEGEALLPPAVWGYVQREHLYGTDTDLKHLSVDELRPIALSYLKPKRVAHVLGTERTAAELARQYGVDETEARIAALLHDCTKKLDIEEQLKLCDVYNIDMDEMERTTLKLQHSRTGAEIARHVFGVSDAVYDAIRYHTTGRPDMTMLEKIIYIADYIEPNRTFDGVEKVRAATARSLEEGILLGLTMTIEEMEGYGTPIHHLTHDARAYLIEHGGTTMTTPKELALLAARALSDKKGREIQVLEIGDLTTIADYFVLATGGSNTQINALVDNVEKVLMEEAGEEAIHREGYRGGTWVLLDYGCIVIHVFNAEAREFYGLERLWRDGKPLSLEGVVTEGN